MIGLLRRAGEFAPVTRKPVFSLPKSCRNARNVRRAAIVTDNTSTFEARLTRVQHRVANQSFKTRRNVRAVMLQTMDSVG